MPRTRRRGAPGPHQRLELPHAEPARREGRVDVHDVGRPARKLPEHERVAVGDPAFRSQAPHTGQRERGHPHQVARMHGAAPLRQREDSHRMAASRQAVVPLDHRPGEPAHVLAERIGEEGDAQPGSLLARSRRPHYGSRSVVRPCWRSGSGSPRRATAGASPTCSSGPRSSACTATSFSGGPRACRQAAGPSTRPGPASAGFSETHRAASRGGRSRKSGEPP